VPSISFKQTGLFPNRDSDFHSNFLIKRIEDVEDVSTEDLVFDTYPQVVAKLKEFDME
jgi:hypothetical protein